MGVIRNLGTGVGGGWNIGFDLIIFVSVVTICICTHTCVHTYLISNQIQGVHEKSGLRNTTLKQEIF